MDRIEEKINAFLDNQLTKEEEEQLMRELAQSGEARAIMKSATRLKDLIVKARLRFEFPADVDERFLSQLGREQVKQQYERGLFKQRVGLGKAVKFSFTALALIGISVSLLIYFQQDQAVDATPGYKIRFLQRNRGFPYVSSEWIDFFGHRVQLRNYYFVQGEPITWSDSGERQVLYSTFGEGQIGNQGLIMATQGTLQFFTRPYRDTTTTLSLFFVEETAGILKVSIGAEMAVGLGKDKEGKFLSERFYLGDSLFVPLGKAVPIDLIKKIHPYENLFLYVTKQTQQQEELEEVAREQGTVHYQAIVQSIDAIPPDQPSVAVKATYVRTDTTGSKIDLQGDFGEAVRVQRIYQYRPTPGSKDLSANVYLTWIRLQDGSSQENIRTEVQLFVIPIRQILETITAKVFEEEVRYEFVGNIWKRRGSIGGEYLGEFAFTSGSTMEFELPKKPRFHFATRRSPDGKTTWYKPWSDVYREKVLISVR